MYRAQQKWLTERGASQPWLRRGAARASVATVAAPEREETHECHGHAEPMKTTHADECKQLCAEHKVRDLRWPANQVAGPCRRRAVVPPVACAFAAPRACSVHTGGTRGPVRLRVTSSRAHTGGSGKQIPGRFPQMPARQVPHSQSLLVLHFLISHPEPAELATHSQLVGQTTPPGWEQWITEQPCSQRARGVSRLGLAANPELPSLEADRGCARTRILSRRSADVGAERFLPGLVWWKITEANKVGDRAYVSIHGTRCQSCWLEIVTHSDEPFSHSILLNCDELEIESLVGCSKKVQADRSACGLSRVHVQELPPAS